MSNEKGSTAEGDFHVTEKLSEEQMRKNDAFNIGSYFLTLFWEEPFFLRIFQACDRVRSRLVPTAGVCVYEGRPTFLWNPDFVSPLPAKHVIGLLKHEAYHLIYNHCTSRRREPHMLWNWATDLSINSVISPSELPEGGLVPGKPFTKPSYWDKMDPASQERFEKLSNLIASFEPNHSADWYFERLLEDPTIKKMIEEAKYAEELLKKLGKECPLNGGGDDHSKWGKSVNGDGIETDLSDGERKLIEAEMRDALASAIREADGGNRWGSIPASMQGRIRSLLSNEVDWRAVLRQFVGMSRRSESKTSRKKSSRKNTVIERLTGIEHAFPGRARRHMAAINVYVDQSGSVDDTALSLLYGELNSLSKRTTIKFFPFDTEVDVENSFVWKKGQRRPELGRFRCGGTSFQAVVDHASSDPECDGVIILTDGECSQPTPFRKRLAYLIAPGQRLCFQPRVGEILIQMTGNKAID